MYSCNHEDFITTEKVLFVPFSYRTVCVVIGADMTHEPFSTLRSESMCYRQFSSMNAHKCETWLDDSLCICADRVIVPRRSWPGLKQYMRMVVCAAVSQLSRMLTLGHASQLCTSIKVREQCTVSSLSMLIAQRAEMQERYTMLIDGTATEMMSELLQKEKSCWDYTSNTREEVDAQYHSWCIGSGMIAEPI